MKSIRLTIGVKLFLAYLLISGGIALFLTDKAQERLTRGIDEAAEEVMIDAANLLAQTFPFDHQRNQIDLEKFNHIVDHYLDREVGAKIYNNSKEKPSMRIYITDNVGIVIYDSDRKLVGEDFSQWRDVKLTLEGKYGARASSIDETVSNPTVEDKGLFVAAAIYHDNEIVGSLTLVKPILSLKPYVLEQQQQLRSYALGIFAISLLFGALASFFVSRSTSRLIKYTTQLTRGEKPDEPNITQVEYRKLAEAIQKLRSELEGREYVEEYIHTLAHELRSPLTSVRANTENLRLPMDDDKKEKIIEGILEANERMDKLMDRLLSLAKIERTQQLENVEKVLVYELIQGVIDSPSRKGALLAKDISVEVELNKETTIMVERLLVEQAISNILDNAIKFSPGTSAIQIDVKEQNKWLTIKVVDNGPGIPEYAKKKIFSRFYSAPHPETGKRGNGLGLRFAKQIMLLHDGSITVSNRAMKQGAEAVLRFPLK
jgi:two-component system sensor histidine kinase CreC